LFDGPFNNSFIRYVIASEAWQSRSSYIEREEIASSFLLAMT